MVDTEVTPDLFEKWLADERVRRTLRELDINADDHVNLFDILDCEHRGSVFVGTVIDGIARLRGDAKKSDIVTVDFMVRSIQNQCNSLALSMAKVTTHLGLQ